MRKKKELLEKWGEVVFKKSQDKLKFEVMIDIRDQMALIVKELKKK